MGKLAVIMALLAACSMQAGAEPIDLKEVSMLLRNGIPPAEVIADVRRRQLLETPSDTEIAALGVPSVLAAVLRDPRNVLGAAERQRLAEREEAQRWARLVSAHRVEIGMSATDVVRSWGNPERINRTTRETGTHEQWVYDGDYLYIKEGRLDSIQTRSQPDATPVATPTPKPKRIPYTQRATIPGNQWVHLVKYGGPNEFMMLTDVEMTHIDLRWKHTGKSIEKKIKSRDRTLIHDDGHGCKTYYVDSIDRKGGTGILEFEHTADSLFNPLYK